jgi:chemotaxis protein CheX
MHEMLCRYITDAAVDVFATMFGLTLTADPCLEETNDTGLTTGVAAVVGIAGPLAGTGTVMCSVEAACRLSSVMLMTEFTELGDDVLDAMGEIANMIVGNVKNNLEADAGPLGLSTPTVVHGRDFATRATAGKAWTVVNFRLDDGHTFCVQMSLAASGAGAHSSARHPVSAAV